MSRVVVLVMCLAPVSRLAEVCLRHPNFSRTVPRVVARNVPKNEALAALQAGNGEAAGVWVGTCPDWPAWTHVRTGRCPWGRPRSSLHSLRAWGTERLPRSSCRRASSRRETGAISNGAAIERRPG